MLASGSVSPLVLQIGLCLLGAGVVAVVFERIRLPSIAAFIAAGFTLGPAGLGLISGKQEIQSIANLGLTLLLFLIGLEVNFRGLMASGKLLVLAGLLQVPLSAAVGWAAFESLDRIGWGAFEDPLTPLYLAVACAFSSTLLVVKVLQQRLQMDTFDGRLCVGVLVFQDIWAIIVLALQPNLATPSLTPAIQTFAGVAIVIAVAAALAHFVLPTAFRWVGKTPELVVTASLAWCFGLGLTGSHLTELVALFDLDYELSISVEMGALIAGASIAAFPYAHEVVSKVSNLRDFFITLFFVALGMSIPIPDHASVLWTTVTVVGLLVLIRYVVFAPVLYVSGADRRHAITAATKLAQLSEFALVIAYLGAELGHIPGQLVTVIMLAFVITAVCTPWLFALADPLHEQASKVMDVLGIHPSGSEPIDEPTTRRPRLVLLGFHRLASSLLHDLALANRELLDDVLVIDFNVALHGSIRNAGVHVVYGDISNAASLVAAGVNRADVVICTIPDDILKGTSNLEVARQVRRINARAAIIVNAVRIADVPGMYAAGADYVFSWRTETSRRILPAIEAALAGDLVSYVETATQDVDLRTRKEVLD